VWANRVKASDAKRAWIYFNNDNDAYAPKNAAALRRILKGFALGTKKGAHFSSRRVHDHE
jgi:uncharacterized protein YecE (DUF72 family)